MPQMSYNSNTRKRALKIVPNTSVEVEYVFDEPKTFDDKYNPGRTRFGYTFRVLDDTTRTYNVGEEVTYFTSYPPEAEKLSAYHKGEQIRLRSVQNPGDRFPTMLIESVGDPLVEPDFMGLDGPTGTEPGKEPARRAAGTPPYPDQDPDIIEMMTRSMMAAMEVRENLVQEGVPREEMGEYWFTKVGLTVWMKVR